jgi:poly(A) polymerase
MIASLFGLEHPLSSVLWDEAIELVRALRGAGHEAYFAGGCVRDHLMGVEPKDVDIATSAKPEEVRGLFPKTNAVGAHFGVVLVHTKVATYEVATFRADMGYSDGRHPDAIRFATAREDVERRDFTINGMFYDPLADEVHDWVGGRDDIARKTIRAIGNADNRFQEDRLRLLRAIRFAARLSFSIEEQTYDAIIRNSVGVSDVSAERIRDELVEILTSPHAGRALRLLHDTGLLKVVLPDVEAMVDVEQPQQFHPEGDVFTHTCMMLDRVRNPTTELAMGLLLHDVGKPSTMSFSGRIRFNSHDRVGAEMAGRICRDLRFANDQIEHIQTLIAHHMRFAHAPRMKQGKLKQLLGLPRFDEHLELHRLDCMASHRLLDIHAFVAQKMEEFDEDDLHPEPILTGHHLIALGYTPGPTFGEILNTVQGLQLDGELNDHDAALAWLKKQHPLESQKDD